MLSGDGFAAGGNVLVRGCFVAAGVLWIVDHEPLAAE
jgi:hypothetical protein